MRVVLVIIMEIINSLRFEKLDFRCYQNQNDSIKVIQLAVDNKFSLPITK